MTSAPDVPYHLRCPTHCHLHRKGEGKKKQENEGGEDKRKDAGGERNKGASMSEQEDTLALLGPGGEQCLSDPCHRGLQTLSTTHRASCRCCGLTSACLLPPPFPAGARHAEPSPTPSYLFSTTSGDDAV
ncbi:hypothetical protein EVG20_g8770 [Dentipellis fragilis]|uniref:Uncharacterized protein n=1 Tax=Dentipellis fragilis TaxID=205917 RepID=A0A4Y9Y2Y8_9AGAM|nr:hypothetical protein EVG20_g8770 [Dentipellis fragilis]